MSSLHERKTALLHAAQHQDALLAHMHVMGQACGMMVACALLGVEAHVRAAFVTTGLALGSCIGLVCGRCAHQKHLGHAQIELPTLAFRNVWDKKPTDWLVVCLVSTRASWPSLILPDLNLHDIVHKVDAVVTNSGHVLT